MNFRRSIFDWRKHLPAPAQPAAPGGEPGAGVFQPSKIENRKSKIPRGSVLVIVMVTLIFTAFALVLFIEKAGNDLIVESRDVTARRLRSEAYSALETTLAVLADFRAVGGGLHHSGEGWSDPLEFAAWEPTEGRTVQVAFEDESGKLSLPRVDALTLTNLFKAWEMPVSDAERLADALMGWMKKEHIYTTSVTPDYENGPIPYLPPARPLRSFSELAAIDVVRDLLFDEGKPNAFWHRFVANVSLYSYARPNLNGAKPDVLVALGQFDPSQQKQVTDYLSGEGSYATQGAGWFTDMNAARGIAGPAGNVDAFTTRISALRISITVREGRAEYRLSTVVAPLQNGATTVQTTATATRDPASASATVAPGSQPAPSGTATASANPNAAANAKKLNYPFTLLEIRENDEIPAPPPPPPVASL